MWFDVWLVLVLVLLLLLPLGGYCPGADRVWPVSFYWSFNETSFPQECTAGTEGSACVGAWPGENPTSLAKRETQVVS